MICDKKEFSTIEVLVKLLHREDQGQCFLFNLCVIRSGYGKQMLLGVLYYREKHEK